MKLLVPAALAVIVVCTAPSYLRADAPDIPIAVEGCPAEELTGVRRILNIELLSISDETSNWLAAGAQRVTIRCEGSVLQIQLRDGAGAPVENVSVNREPVVEQDINRYVALTIVELIASGAAERVTRIDDTASDTGGGVSAPEVRISLREPVSTRRFGAITLAPLFRSGGEPFWMTYGAVLSGSVALVPKLRLAIDAEVSTGSETVSLGEIRSTIFSGSLSLAGSFVVGRVDIQPGIGFRGGGVAWRGAASEPESTNEYAPVRAWAGSYGILLITVSASRLVDIATFVEAGGVLIEAGAEVGETRALAVAGAWISFGVGLRFRIG